MPASGQEIEGYLLSFSAQARKLTGIGVAFLVVTALTMLTNIEKVFNAIWRTRGHRSGLSSFLRYWAILSLGPLCIGLALGISTYLVSLHWLAQVDLFGARKLLLNAAPLLLTIVAFTLLFAAMPNCRVPIRHALIGGAVCGFCLEIAKQLFALVMANASYQLIYGTFAAIPLFLLWIYISWIIVLAGAEMVHALSGFNDPALVGFGDGLDIGQGRHHLKQMGLETEVSVEAMLGRIGRFNGRNHLVPVEEAQLIDHGLPFPDGGFPPLAVAGDEKFFGLVKLGFQFFETGGYLFEFRIGKKVRETAQKWKRVFLDVGMNAPFNETQLFKAFPGQKPFVTQAHQPVGNLRGFQADFLGAQFLVTAPVTEIHGDEDALAGQGFKDFVVLCFHKV